MNGDEKVLRILLIRQRNITCEHAKDEEWRGHLENTDRRTRVEMLRTKMMMTWTPYGIRLLI